MVLVDQPLTIAIEHAAALQAIIEELGVMRGAVCDSRALWISSGVSA